MRWTRLTIGTQCVERSLIPWHVRMGRHSSTGAQLPSFPCFFSSQSASQLKFLRPVATSAHLLTQPSHPLRSVILLFFSLPLSPSQSSYQNSHTAFNGYFLPSLTSPPHPENSPPTNRILLLLISWPLSLRPRQITSMRLVLLTAWRKPASTIEKIFLLRPMKNIPSRN